MDLLLSMIHATTSTGNAKLLTFCSAGDTSAVVSMLDDIPTLDRFALQLKLHVTTQGHDHCLAQTLTTYYSQLLHGRMIYGERPSNYTLLESVILKACSSYRGFLISATGPRRIPSFGNNQFLLANMAPDLELAFSRHIPTPQSPTQIVFHGTSFDHLHAILCQGLRVQSGTALQRNGAVYGPGIYMADEPRVAWGYATVSSGGWKSSKLKNMRVLLGCELAGPKPQASAQAAGGGIYVITDPTMLAVRYIFLLGASASMPAAKDVRMPMESVFQGLRSGTL